MRGLDKSQSREKVHVSQDIYRVIGDTYNCYIILEHDMFRDRLLHAIRVASQVVMLLLQRIRRVSEIISKIIMYALQKEEEWSVFFPSRSFVEGFKHAKLSKNFKRIYSSCLLASLLQYSTK